MIDKVGGAPLQAYDKLAYDAAREAAQSASFEETLKEAQNVTEKKFTGLTRGKLTLTPEEQEAQQDRKLKEACQGFEAMFMELMYKKMRDTVPEDTLFGDSNAHKIWQSMLDSEMMQAAAKSGGLGLGDMLYKQLKPTVMANLVDKNA